MQILSVDYLRQQVAEKALHKTDAQCSHGFYDIVLASVPKPHHDRQSHSPAQLYALRPRLWGFGGVAAGSLPVLSHWMTASVCMT